MSTPAARLARALALRRPTPPARPQTIWAGADAWRTRRRPLTVGKTPVEAEFVHDAPRVSPEALARAREQHEAAMRDFKAALLAEVDEMARSRVVRAGRGDAACAGGRARGAVRTSRGRETKAPRRETKAPRGAGRARRPAGAVRGAEGVARRLELVVGVGGPCVCAGPRAAPRVFAGGLSPSADSVASLVALSSPV